MPDAQLRGKTKNLHFYEVLNIKVVAAPVPEYV
jgi:hypothetical protein